MRALSFSSLPSLLLFISFTAHAQVPVAQDPAAPVEAVPDDVAAAVKDAAKEERKQGFSASARVGASGLVLHNHKVVGQLDGFTLQSGLVLGGTLNLLAGQHEWQNSASYDLSFLKTPSVEPFLKSADNLEARSLYLYRIPGVEWLGPFARVRGYTQVFPGYAVPVADTFVRRIDTDGSENVFLAPGQEALPLTTWLEPIVLAESLGGFVRPLQETWLSLDGKAGLGAQHVLIFGNGYVVADDVATPELDIRQLQTVHSLGLEVELEAKGALLQNISYGLLATVYYPIFISVETDLELVERIHVDVAGNISYKLTEWLSADYVVRLRRAPFVLNDWQLQNSLLLTLGFNIL